MMLRGFAPAGVIVIVVAATGDVFGGEGVLGEPPQATAYPTARSTKARRDTSSL